MSNNEKQNCLKDNNEMPDLCKVDEWTRNVWINRLTNTVLILKEIEARLNKEGKFFEKRNGVFEVVDK